METCEPTSVLMVNVPDNGAAEARLKDGPDTTVSAPKLCANPQTTTMISFKARIINCGLAILWSVFICNLLYGSRQLPTWAVFLICILLGDLARFIPGRIVFHYPLFSAAGAL